MHSVANTISSIPEKIPVIVADSSTDNTLSLIPPNIKIVNGGLPAVARNNGALKVETEYILFLDADMDISSVPINLILNDMVANGYDLVTTKILVKGKYNILYNLFYYIQKLISRKTPFAPGGFMLFKKDTFDKLNGFNIKDVFAEDYHLSMKIDPKKFKIHQYPAYTLDRRLKNKGVLYMVKLMLKCFINRNNDSFYTKEYNYWK